MLSYRIKRGQGPKGLELVEFPSREPGPGEVRIRIHAVALNYRDLLVANGQMGSGDQVVPGSEAAGEIVEVAADVTRFRIGDRVSPLFFPDWIDGPPAGASVGRSLGGNTDGVLAEQIVAHESACVALPFGLAWSEAATMPCGGLTAWTALFEAAGARAGQVVVIQGTGGVSTWALQLAKAAGLGAVVLSSSHEKLERARQLGADTTINYVEKADWDQEIQRLGGGADIVLDVGGAGTIERSISATRPGGVVVAIGGVSGSFALSVPPFALVGNKRLTGALVGNRQNAEAFAKFVETAQLRPVVAHEYPFREAGRAYQSLAGPGRFGPVVIRCDR